MDSPYELYLISRFSIGQKGSLFLGFSIQMLELVKRHGVLRQLLHQFVERIKAMKIISFVCFLGIFSFTVIGCTPIDEEESMSYDCAASDDGDLTGCNPPPPPPPPSAIEEVGEAQQGLSAGSYNVPHPEGHFIPAGGLDPHIPRLSLYVDHAAGAPEDEWRLWYCWENFWHTTDEPINFFVEGANSVGYKFIPNIVLLGSSGCTKKMPFTITYLSPGETAYMYAAVHAPSGNWGFKTGAIRIFRN